MTERLLTDDDMAQRLGKSTWFVQDRCKGDAAWPHLRVGKSIRFTPEHVAAIDALLEVKSGKKTDAPASAWGRRGRSAS